MKRYVILASLALLSSTAQAQFRCDGALIDERYSKLDVQRICGEPELKDHYNKHETVMLNGKDEEVTCLQVDQWYYRYGTNQTTYIVEFEKGFVTRVIRGRDKP